MRKIIYIFTDNIDSKKLIGVKKKITGQINAFKNKNYDVDLVKFKNKSCFINEKKIFSYKNNFHKRLIMWNRLFNYIKNHDYKIMYIRYSFSDIYFYYFLKKIYKFNLISIIEFPTFPYDGERKVNNLKIFLNILFDKIFRRRIYKYISFCINFNNYKKIYNIKSISIQNGVDLESIEYIDDYKKNKNFNLIGVGNVSFWHGYDRVIKSLHEYYKRNRKRKIYFHIIGEGDEIINLKKLTQKLSLNRYIFFYGFLEGEDLKNIYKSSNFGVDSLALFRKNLSFASSLKLKEYISLGLPVIMGYRDIGLIKLNKLIYIVPNSNDLIDLDKLVIFYDKISPEERTKLRLLAKKKYSWDTQYLKVFRKIKKMEIKLNEN